MKKVHPVVWDLLAGLAVLALYLFTATRTVQGGDSGELITIAMRGGVAHPPGYPLYSLLARAFGLLPFGTPAFRIALLSAVCGAGTVTLLSRLARSLGARPLAAFTAALALGLSTTFWRYAGVPEVFALHALLSVALLQVKHPFFIGLVGGLGMANHHTTVLLAPVVIAALGRSPKRWGWAAVGGTLGLLPYLGLVVDAGAWRWGDVTWSTLVHHVLRRAYGTFQLSAGHVEPGYVRHAVIYVAELPKEWLLFLLPALVGLPRLGLRYRLSLILALAFLSIMNIPTNDVGRAIAERFTIFPQVLLGVSVALGIEALLVWRRRIWWTVLPAIFALGLWNLPRADWRHANAVERYLEDALEHAAPGALILGAGDVHLFGFLYAREVRKLRPDVDYVDLHLLRYRWYFDRVGNLGVPYDAQTTDTLGLLRAQIAHRPVYLAVRVGQVARWPAYPEGVLIRLAGNHPPPPPERLELLASKLSPGRGADPWSRIARAAYARTWTVLADTYDRDGSAAAALRARDRARVIESGH